MSEDDIENLKYSNETSQDIKSNLEAHGNTKVLDQMISTRKKMKDGEYLDTRTVIGKHREKDYGLVKERNRKRARLIERLNEGRYKEQVDAEDGTSVNKALDDYAKDKEKYIETKKLENKYKEAKKEYLKEALSKKRVISEESYQQAKKNFKENSQRLNTGIPFSI